MQVIEHDTDTIGARKLSEWKDTHNSIKNVHASMLRSLRELATHIKNEDFTIPQSVDIGYLLREIESHIDEVRKDVKAHKDAIGKQTAYRLVMNGNEKCRGELATGSMKATYYSSLPHPEHESEKFYALCKHFAIDPSQAPLGGVRFHWPTMKKHITHCMEQGIPLPDELSDTKSELEMTYRRLPVKGD